MESALQGGCCSSVWFVFYEKGAVALLMESTQQGGRCSRAMLYFYEHCVMDWFGDFTNILLFVGVFPSRGYCVALDWEIDAGMEIERFGIGIAVLPWQL